MLHQLIRALPNFCYLRFGGVEVPSQPGGYSHLHQLLSVPNGQSRSCDGQQASQLRLSSSFLQNEQIVTKGATPRIKQIAKLTTAVVLAAIAIALCAYAFMLTKQ